MSWIDWVVLVGTLLFIALYGMWKSRGMRNIEGYLLADKKLPWYHVGLSVMATQASAITFLSAPGLGYADGLRFVQFYFGLPLAMIVICIVFIPIFKNLNVYTAYEYLENRFDIKTRSLTAFLFLLQRGLSTGITIYAPAIILSSILNISIIYTTFIMGGIVILYTVYGGTKAVSYTQMFQMIIIFSGLFMAAFMVVYMLPQGVGFTDALHIAGKMGRTNAIDTTFDLNNRYNIWSGIIGGFFLQLSYFGTDQSQVGRYLTGSSVSQSRLGLVMNGLVKIPMQFFILLIGVLVFTFYQFHTPPVFFNSVEVNSVENSEYARQFKQQEELYQNTYTERRQYVDGLVDALHTDNQSKIDEMRTALRQSDSKANEVRDSAIRIISAHNKLADKNDSNYVFLGFVTQYLPTGMVGLLIAIIFLAAMGSTASGLNSLASTYIVDFYKRFTHKNGSDQRYLNASRWATVVWGLFCMVVALYAGKLGNLIEAVNILGSLFYGVILGIFITAFFAKHVKGTAVFYAALLGEVFVVAAWLTDLTSFLWLNLIGCVLVFIFALVMQAFMKEESSSVSEN
ncbi:MAG: sodium:solute symporter [Bacteroidota bacterium]